MISYEENRIPLEECKKTLNVDGDEFTDEEIIMIRDWLYHMADIAIAEYDRKHENLGKCKPTIKEL